ncbi:MAG: hypothetical protein CSYNP_03472 [Syntrophus sp. SKADARSKE-3]|nr:hypothetical protein [Syntrophus sp. SKADARSKE-3]
MHSERHFNPTVQLIILLLLSSLFTGCVSLSPRLQESGLNSGFGFNTEKSFDIYVQENRDLIEKARVDLNEINRESVIKANAPFELRPDTTLFPKTRQGKYQKGVLLIHGLSDSPYMMQPIARHLQARGFLVRAILLPGHGTVPGDLLSVTYGEWINAMTYGLKTLKADAGQVYMGGFSTGGALCVFQALQDREIKGLFLFSPALGLKDKRAALAGILGVFSEWVGSPRDDTDYAKYESFATNAAGQIYGLTQELANRLGDRKLLEAPVFAAFSEDDETVDAARTLEVMGKNGASKKNRLIVYTKKPRPDQEGPNGTVVYDGSYIPEEHILDFSHIAITIPPDDPHYGRNGGYKCCLHYMTEPEKRRLCLLGGATLWQGENSSANLQAATMRRLSYNPLFPRLLGQLDGFLKDVEIDH